MIYCSKLHCNRDCKRAYHLAPFTVLITTINYKPDKDGKCEGELKDEGVSCGSDDGTVREDDE